MADKALSFPLDVERVIDDIVLFCMLVGNDFLPVVLEDPAVKVAGTTRSSGYVPLHQELLAAEARARHTVQQFAVDYLPSGMACRQLRVHPRMLGRLTGNVWVEDNQGERVDIGLAVKNAKQGLCVPGAVAKLYELFPHIEEPEQQDAKLQELRSWLKGLPSAKLPLVAASTQQASDAAVQRLQLLLPGLLPVGSATLAPVELELVHPSLLLPPYDPAAARSVLSGGLFEPGDRVVVLKGTGSPAFGTRGTVIGVLPASVELLMDEEFAGEDGLSHLAVVMTWHCSDGTVSA
eukprot:gene1729-2072_t